MKDFMNLTRPQNYKSNRDSSWDKSGGNWDSWQISAGETKVLADLKGPGVISHIWFTIASPDAYYLRKLLLKIYWDGESEPSVLSPVGDFFGLGHSQSFTYNSAPFTCSSNGERVGEGVAMNCWLPMPFKKSARVEIVNEQAEQVNAFYFYIDWQAYESLPDDTLYLHAMWRRENPCIVPDDDGGELKENMLKGRNLTDKYNYLLLYAEGNGHYIGSNLSIDNTANAWWGEGDDMFFIDRDDGTPEIGGTWPPNLHGTGSEDYLCQAWGMQHHNSLYYGEPWCEEKEGTQHHNKGKVCVYRYHLEAPVPFTKKLRVSIEHGHANDQRNDYASVAYWYQDEPHRTFIEILPVEKRLPNTNK